MRMLIKRLCTASLLLLPVLLFPQAGCDEAGVDWPAAALTAASGMAASQGDELPLPDSATPEGDSPALEPVEQAPALAAEPPTMSAPTKAPEPTATQPATLLTGEAKPSPTPSPAPTETPMPEALPTSPPVLDPIIEHVADSAGGRAINSYRFGYGATDLVLVGGMHGGYEWNSILLAQAFLTHFTAQGEALPDSITLHIIPNANPDGLAVVTGRTIADLQLQPTDIITHTLAGRFNANGVDLNRNWDCLWAEQAFWRDQTISGGAYPFSEPETAELSRYLLELKPALVVFLHSTAGAIFTSGCPEMHEESAALAVVYGLAANYPVYPAFTYYPITGDASDWLTTQGIPSFTVELTTRDAIDWEQNLAGLQAVLEHLHTPEDKEPVEGMNLEQ